jgi:GTP-binding protein SAR1
MAFQSIYEMWRSLVDTLWKALGFFEGKEGSLLVLGLDNAGKTTMLHRLRTGGDVRSFPPTDRPRQTEEFETAQGIKFKAWDMGGHEAVRHLWEDYVCESSAVFFLIDVVDQGRFEEAGFELDALIGEKIVQDLPLAILLNKCDLEEAASTAEVCEKIHYEDLRKMQGDDKIAVFRMSVLKGEGYQAAFRWVADFL